MKITEGQWVFIAIAGISILNTFSSKEMTSGDWTVTLIILGLMYFGSKFNKVIVLLEKKK